MIKSLVIVAAVLATLPTFGPYYAKAERVVDGDTVDLKISVLPRQTNDIRLRLKDIDAWEMNCPNRAGVLAKEYVELLIMGQSPLMVEINGIDSFGRYIGDIFLSNGKRLSQELLLAGLAQPYKRGQSKCPEA